VILHICSPDNQEPPLPFLRAWGKPLARGWFTVPTHQLAQLDELPYGAYLFTDQDRQTPEQKALLAQVWEQLAGHEPHVRLFNHPLRAKGRRELLRSLSDLGRNDFRAIPVDELPGDLRYPVFLRLDEDHCGSRTPLIETSGELEREIVGLLLAGAPRRSLLVVEFCDTADARGIYRKYSMFRFGERLIPRHIHFSRNWMLKFPDLVDADKLAEERAYLEENPHEEALREVFDLAGLQYGRADYAFQDGRMQVWEVNSNPMVTLNVEDYQKVHLEQQEWFAVRALEAFRAMEPEPRSGKVPIRLQRPMEAFSQP
jgi:hypothetical protein